MNKNTATINLVQEDAPYYTAPTTPELVDSIRSVFSLEKVVVSPLGRLTSNRSTHSTPSLARFKILFKIVRLSWFPRSRGFSGLKINARRSRYRARRVAEISGRSIRARGGRRR